MSRVALDFRKIDFNRIRVEAVTETKQGGGKTAKTLYQHDDGTLVPIDLQLPKGVIPFEFSSFEDKGESWSLTFELDQTNPHHVALTKFLEELEEFVLDTVFKRAKEFLPPATYNMKNFSKETLRALMKPTIKHGTQPGKYQPYFSTHVQKKIENDVVIPDQFNITCLHEGQLFDVRKITARSTYNSAVINVRAITNVQKFGPSIDCKRVTITALGSPNNIVEDPTMFADEYVEQNYYDQELVKKAEEVENAHKRQKEEEEEHSETSLKEQQQQQQQPAEASTPTKKAKKGKK